MASEATRTRGYPCCRGRRSLVADLRRCRLRIGAGLCAHTRGKWMRPKAQHWLVALTIVVLCRPAAARCAALARTGYGASHAGRVSAADVCGIRVRNGVCVSVEAVLSRFDQLGVASLTLATATLTVWMIPAALDATLADPATAMTKYTTLVVTGFAVHGVIVGPRWRCSRSSSWASRG